MSCYVTVGTTSFNQLVDTVLSGIFYEVLTEKGYKSLLVQSGNSDVIDYDGASRNIEIYRYKPSILEDINTADLVISHAGAGSCLEVMHAGKPCIVVINDELMDNHQVELAEKLHELGCIEYTTPKNLIETLTSFDPTSLRPYQRGNPKIFADFLNQVT